MSLSICLASALMPFSLAFAESVNGNFQFEMYFSDVKSWATGERSGEVSAQPDGAVVSALRRFLTPTRTSLKMAIYGVEDQAWFFNKLESLKEQGVAVQAVVDQRSGDFGEWRRENFTYGDTITLPTTIGRRNVIPDLNPEGQPRAASIMHNKFLVRDTNAVWFGSANISSTCSGAEYNANSSIRIDSADVARRFTAEFRQMYADKSFSNEKSETSDKSPIRFSDGTVVDVFFSPQDDAVHEAIIPFIRTARSSIKIGMFYLTHESIIEELIAAARRGVQVRVILDALSARHPSSKVEELREGGVVVRVENWGGKMHMKSAVADGKHVIIGSMNWTQAGNQDNDENTVVIRNNTAAASQMEGHLDQLWDLLRYAPDYPAAESLDSINSCFDGVDNDHDGIVDRSEPACQGIATQSTH
jgi:phosphatidylserine/phosphatidylglycerophosphate/cardiolipin synthase-like enzyme